MSNPPAFFGGGRNDVGPADVHFPSVYHPQCTNGHRDWRREGGRQATQENRLIYEALHFPLVQKVTDGKKEARLLASPPP